MPSQGNESSGIAAALREVEAREATRRRVLVERRIDVGKRGGDGMPEDDRRGEDDPLDDEEVCLDLGEPSQEVIDYARRELGETDDVKCRTLQELRDMIYGNDLSTDGSPVSRSIEILCSTERGECLPRRMDDDFLIRFLRTRNFNVNRAHRLVSSFSFESDPF